MWARKQQRDGFTIVELLIVIVVIGILAAISIVAYNGVQNRAKAAAIQSDLAGASKQLEMAKFGNSSEQYPVSLVAANLKASNGTVFDYNYDSGSNTYCLSATNAAISYSITNTNPVPTGGDCSTNSLVAWWPFNGNANDQSGNNNNGIVTATSLITGQNGQSNNAYSFNGTTSFISATFPTVAVTNVTISGWALIQSGVTKGTIAHVGAGNGYSIGVGTGLNSLDARVVALFPGVRWIISSTAATTGWHLFTLVLDASGTPTLYLDGVSAGSYVGSRANIPTAQISMGRNIGDEGASQAERSFNSSLDDIRVYSRALPQSEIQSLYSAGAK